MRHASVAPVVALVEPVVPRRRTEVEALRGLAAMGVLLSHCWGIGHDYSGYVFGTRLGRLGLSGGEGLVLFFVLSGYLLTRMFVSGAAKGRPVVLTIYLRHRALRILPTWFLVLAVLLVVHDEGVARSHWWRFPLLLQGFWQDTVIRVDGPAWSLAVEAQFYLLLPLLALLLRRSLALALGTVVVLGTAAAALRLGTVTYDHPTVVWNYSLPANVVYFCPGIALAVLEVRTSLVAPLRTVPHVRALLLLGSLPFWLAFAWAPRAELLSTVAAGLTVAAVALPLDEGRLVTVLRSQLLLVLGTLSFGIYLWHEPVVRLLHEHGVGSWAALVVLTVPIAGALAAASHLLAERPFLRLRDARAADLRTSHPDVRAALAGVVVTLLAGLLALAT